MSVLGFVGIRDLSAPIIRHDRLAPQKTKWPMSARDKT